MSSIAVRNGLATAEKEDRACVDVRVWWEEAAYC